MSMEKIRITEDDIAHISEPVNVQQPPVQVSGVQLPSLPAGVPANSPVSTGGRLVPWLVAAAVAAIATVSLLVAFSSREREVSLDKWKDAERKRLNTEVATSPNSKQYIESIHPLVTFTGAAVKSLAVSTVDGSQRPGKNGNNIAEVEFVITYHWEGPVQKNGYTEVLYVWDKQVNRLKTSRYLNTTATMNLDDIDWFQLGFKLAPFLFGGD